MANYNEKNALLACDEPRLSLSSIQPHIGGGVKQEISFAQALVAAFKGPKIPTEADGQAFKHVVANISEKKSGVDVSISTSGLPYNGRVTLQGSVPRPAQVHLKSARSKLTCPFPDHEEGQKVHMVVKSIHGTVQVGLPRDYDGYVLVRTMVGYMSRDATLKKNCIAVKNSMSGADLAYKIYRVQPTLAAGYKKEDVKDADFDAHHVCKLTSFQGRIDIGYTDDMKAFSEGARCAGLECTVS